MTNPFVTKLRRLAELTDVDAAALEAATARPRRYAAREDLIREGDEPGPMFVVMRGGPAAIRFCPAARGRSWRS